VEPWHEKRGGTVSYRILTGAVFPFPFLFFFLSKNNPRLTSVARVSVRRAFSALRILAARKMDEARANISTICAWPECGKSMPSARPTMSAERAAIGSGASSFV